MAMIRVADYIMKRIYEEGARHLFYVPGGQCEEANSSPLRCTMSRQLPWLR